MSAPSPATKPLNILLITSDQHHFSCLGSVNPKIKTPNLDKLAAQGMRFRRAYCNNPVCSPSRSTIITGLYPSQHHCWTIGVSLPRDIPTVGDLFQKHGYDVALIGKAHFEALARSEEQPSIECQPIMRDLDFWRNFHGPYYGFNHIELCRNHADESHAGQHYGVWMEEKGLKNWKDYFCPWPPVPRPEREPARYWEQGRAYAWDLPEEFHYNTWIADRTIARLEENVKADKPTFLWASFPDPHPPYLVPEPWASMYKPEDVEIGHLEAGELEHLPEHFAKTQQVKPDFSNWKETEWANHGCHSHLHDEARFRKEIAVYYGMTSYMDEQIGRILEALERLGMAENTLVVFTTDHGHFLGQHGLVAKGPYHFEDMLKIPFIARYAQHIPAGMVNDSLQALIDLPETFLDAAGIPIPGLMQGVSQMPVWTGKAVKAREEVMVENRHQPTKLHLRTYIDQRYKMTVYRDESFGELFDLQEDPNELHNRWDDPGYAAVKAEVLHRFVNAEIKREPTRFPRIWHA